ncbi:hypothetical protein GGI12_006082 [Dipsacomyces acuminosporus]|nr:hypothetical protein GGI12_006082 [Dipsacomyces acuminosporus]
MLSAARGLHGFGGHSAATRAFHRVAPQAAAAGILGKLFGGRKTEETKTPAVGDSISESNSSGSSSTSADQARQTDHFASSSNKPIQPMFPKREFSPARLELRIKDILEQNQVSLASPDWKSTGLSEKSVKLRVLSDVMKYVKLPVTSRALNNIQTVGDLLVELEQKPVSKDAGHQVAQFYTTNESAIPENMKFEPFAKSTRRLHVHQ